MLEELKGQKRDKEAIQRLTKTETDKLIATPWAGGTMGKGGVNRVQEPGLSIGNCQGFPSGSLTVEKEVL